MLTASRECPKCLTTLSSDAAFCHKCGTATPIEINPATGEIHSPDLQDVEDAARRADLQQALGDTYEVRRLLGRGGFAEVFVAFDKRLKREIAVKTIRGDLVVNDMLLQRFQSEAEAVAKLRHPNVVPIYSVGESDGVAFFTMPLIDGESLASLIDREQRVPVKEGVRILREASHALNAAHRAGIVHRDIKPENIMLEGPEHSIVVMDFGIAKSSESDSKGLTGTGMIVGTPHYMSPEQAMGEKALDARSDQYALATVGYRMLTGRTPFDGDSMQTLIFKTVTEVPAPASEWVPEIPPELSRVLAKALSKRQEDRYESMADFAAALAPFEHDVIERTGPRGRARVEMATRVRDMLAGIPRLRAPVVIAAVALIATIALLFATIPPVAIAIGGQRDDALFAAKTFLAKHTTNQRRDDFISHTTSDSTFRFLVRAAGFEGAQAHASTDVTVWYWGVRSVSREGKDDWTVWIGPQNRVTSYRKQIADTVAGPRLSIDSARVLAIAALQEVGWTPAQLEALPDSTIARKARTDFQFRWRARKGAIQWKGADSAYTRLLVTVSGGSVTRFVESLQKPESYTEAKTPPIAGGLIGLAMFAAVVFAIVLLVRRAQVDELQWQMMIRLVVFTGFVFSLGQVPHWHELFVTSQAVGGSGISDVIFSIIGYAIVGVCLVCVGVTGESLTYAQRPGAVSGLGDASRGKLVIPEMVDAAAFGYAAGGVAILCSVFGDFAALRLDLGKPPSHSYPFSRIALAGAPVNAVTLVVSFALLLLLVAAVAHNIPRLKRASLIVPGLFVAGFGMIENPSAVAVIALGVAVTVMTYVFWYHGTIAGCVALISATVVDDAYTLIRTGDAGYIVAGVVLVLLFVAPAILAFIAYRRYSKPSTSPPRPTLG